MNTCFFRSVCWTSRRHEGGNPMNQIAALAVACAERPDVLLQIYDGYATVHIGEGIDRAGISAKLDDEVKIGFIIQYLNAGKFMKKGRDVA